MTAVVIVPAMEVDAAAESALRTATEALRQNCVPGLRVTERSPGFIGRTFAQTSVSDPGVREEIGRREVRRTRSPWPLPSWSSSPTTSEIGSIVVRPTPRD